MTTVVAAVVGYLIGALPTAQAAGRIWGVDLRRGGTGNPGANNARRLGGLGLAGLVLLVEAGKGAGAVLLGQVLAGDPGAVAAGVGAVGGNVFNVWYRFQGGKGLGISAGIMITVWPQALGLSAAVIVLTVLVTRSSGLATLTTIVALDVMGLAWYFFEWSNSWGIDRTELLIWLAAGITVIIWRKHWSDWQVTKSARRELPTRA